MPGVAAALRDKANKVGIVAGADEAGHQRDRRRLAAGHARVNPDIEDMVAYANTWTDPTKGKELRASCSSTKAAT